jgi:energy-converting hydrogenase Eha subunit C
MPRVITDMFLRAIAILIEVIILGGIICCLLGGAWLTLFDLGLDPKYKKIITMALALAGLIVVVFCIAHLTLFYPGT